MRKRKNPVPLEAEDKAFFMHFYEENKNFIYFVARKYASNPGDCDDLVQEATVRLMRNVSSLRNTNSCKWAKYIALTVKTAYLDILKRKNKENLIYMDNEALEALMTEKLEEQDFEQHVSASDTVARLKDSLSARDWAVIEGKYILGLSQEELAAMFGISPDSVRMTLHRARENAKAVLEKIKVTEVMDNV